jgi:hypothetical protein
LKTPLFLIYGVMLIGASAYAHYSGWSLTRVNEQKVAPKTVRDNPGSYRALYWGYSRYIGGK